MIFMLKKSQLKAPIELKVERYFVDGERAKKQNLEKCDSILVGSFGADDNAAYGFTEEKELLSFATSIEGGNSIAEFVGIARAAQMINGHELAGMQDRQIVRMDAVIKEISMLANARNISDPFLGALSATFHSEFLEGPIFDPALLFSNSPPGGSFIPGFHCKFPVLGWFNFDNKASSVVVAGLTALFADTWFRGQKVLCFNTQNNSNSNNPPWWLDLGSISFDNKASSAMIF